MTHERKIQIAAEILRDSSAYFGNKNADSRSIHFGMNVSVDAIEVFNIGMKDCLHWSEKAEAVANALDLGCYIDLSHGRIVARIF